MKMTTRREMRDLTSRFKAGLLAPVMAVPFEPGEAGTVAQTCTFELDPVAGRVITPMYAEVVSVFVPVTAIEHLLDPADPTADIPEVVKQKYLTGAVMYDLENETEISKRLGIVPQKIADVQKVCSIGRLAYNAAVNYLRQRKYAYAVEVLHGSTAILPAILSETVLDRLQGVLDPAALINGQVALDIGTMNLPIPGIARVGGNTGAGAAEIAPGSGGISVYRAATSSGINFDLDNTTERLTATFDGQATGVSLVDFYKAQNHDKMTRLFAEMVKINPVDGEEQVLRYVHGFTMEPGRNPMVVFERRVPFGMDIRQATDGTALLADTMMSKAMQQINFNVVIPRSEIGGILVTMASVKPDEAIVNQPHPVLSKPWAARNHVDDEMALDPVPVLMRDVNAEVPTGNETTVAFYGGLHGLYRMYTNYGMTRNTDPVDIEGKTAIWQVEIPASVTPENVLYPTVDQYPFIDQLAEICRFRVQSLAGIATPRVFGPTPVEEVDVIESEALLT